MDNSYFDNVITKFIINNRKDAWNTDVNLLIRAQSLLGCWVSGWTTADHGVDSSDCKRDCVGLRGVSWRWATEGQQSSWNVLFAQQLERCRREYRLITPYLVQFYVSRRLRSAILPKICQNVLRSPVTLSWCSAHNLKLILWKPLSYDFNISYNAT